MRRLPVGFEFDGDEIHGGLTTLGLADGARTAHLR
jgi:hypothetical protein